jgi:hypothetical protein
MFFSAVWILLLASGQVLAALDPEEMQRRLLAGAPILGEFSCHCQIMEIIEFGGRIIS